MFSWSIRRDEGVWIGDADLWPGLVVIPPAVLFVPAPRPPVLLATTEQLPPYDPALEHVQVPASTYETLPWFDGTGRPFPDSAGGDGQVEVTSWDARASSQGGTLTLETLRAAVERMEAANDLYFGAFDRAMRSLVDAFLGGRSLGAVPELDRHTPPDDDLVETLLEYARAGDKAQFTELATMRGVPAGEIDTMWTGTLRRLGKKP